MFQTTNQILIQHWFVGILMVIMLVRIINLHQLDNPMGANQSTLDHLWR